MNWNPSSIPTTKYSRGNSSTHTAARGRYTDEQIGKTEHETALLIMPADRRTLFLEALAELGVDVCCAGDCREARELLSSSPAVRLIVTYVSLPDGNWCDVLRMMTDLGVPASVVVDAPEINQTLWSEVFWRGAYDLLVQPCDWNDLCHCLEGALRSEPFSPRLSNVSLPA